MYANTDITLFLWTPTGYPRKISCRGFWYETYNGSVDTRGKSTSKIAHIFIGAEQLHDVLQCTLQTDKDLIIKGYTDILPIQGAQNEVAEWLLSLKESCVVRTIASVKFCDFGSDNMRHYYITAK